MSGSGSKKLLIVSTRGHADKGGQTNDEFVNEWGCAEDDDHHWFPNEDDDDVALLLLHGYTGSTPDKAIKDACNNIPQKVGTIDQSKIWFFDHPLGDNKGSPAKSAIEQRFSSSTIIQKVFHSAGGLAVNTLLRLLDGETGEDKSIFTKFSKAVSQALRGRGYFVTQLHDLQAAFLNWRLGFETAWPLPKDHPNEKQAIAIVTEAGGDIDKISELGKFFDWLDFSSKTARPTQNILDSIGLLQTLARSNGRHVDGAQVDLKAPKIWESIDTATGVMQSRNKPQVQENIRSDIALFSRSLDLLIEASEALPLSLPESGPDETKET